MKSKKVGGILAKPAPKKGKTITTETLHLVTNVYEDGNFSRCLKRTTMLVHKQGVKKYMNKNFAIRKGLRNLEELYTAFKEKYSNVDIGFSKFCALRPKWCALAGSKMTHSICVCSADQNLVLLDDAMDWDLIYKDLIEKIVYKPESNNCIMCRCESCPGTATLKEFLNQELNKHEDGEKSDYCQWNTTDRAILTTFTTTYKEYKETLIDAIDDLTRHSCIAKLKLTSSLYRTKSKATIGVKNTASYIPCLYTTWDQMVASNMTNCVLVLMTTTITQAFYIKFKQCFLIILKLITHI